ncbi:MAG: DUF559 domain-containing protein [Arachnia sp.]
MNTRIQPLCGHGVVTRTDLLASGMKRATLAALIENGDVVRLDRSRFALPGTDPGIITAVSQGGTLTCMSALTLSGVHVLDDTLTHLRRPACRRGGREWATGVMECSLPPRRNASIRGALTLGPTPTTLVRTDGFTKCDAGTQWPDHPLDGIDAALRIACTNHSDEELAVVLDSILCKRLRSTAQLRALLDGHSRRISRLVALADAGSESVLESVVRHRLTSRGIAVQTQVRIPDLGRVDMLLGKSLIVETDGFEFHADRESFREDRRRDRTAVALGYSVIRLTWEQVFSSWPQTMADIAAIVSTRRHMRPPRGSHSEQALASLPRKAS